MIKFITILLILSSSVHAFTVNFFDGEIIRWNTTTINYHFRGKVPKLLIKSVQRATKAWSAASGGAISFIEDDSKGIEIVWDRLNEYGLGQFSTSISERLIEGANITAGTIVINARGFRWHCGKPYGGYGRTNKKGVANLDGIVLHEFGECLGLCAPEEENIVGEWGLGNMPIMWPIFYAGVLDPPTLHEDDIAGIQFLYPNGS